MISGYTNLIMVNLLTLKKEGKMERVDERTQEQMKTHNWLITATDKCMSGWGKCSDGLSKCAWACESKNVDKVFKWVENRKEMKYVNCTNRPWYPKNAEHIHIYVVKEGHISLKKGG